MTTTPITIQEAKERITIPDLWTYLTLNGTPPAGDGVTHSPFREDSSPSFSIYNDGKRFKDHGTGEGGDVITFYAMARNLENREAAREFLTLAAQWI